MIFDFGENVTREDEDLFKFNGMMKLLLVRRDESSQPDLDLINNKKKAHFNLKMLVKV
jgi:hypothetical protein